MSAIIVVRKFCTRAVLLTVTFWSQRLVRAPYFAQRYVDPTDRDKTEKMDLVYDRTVGLQGSIEVLGGGISLKQLHTFRRAFAHILMNDNNEGKYDFAAIGVGLHPGDILNKALGEAGLPTGESALLPWQTQTRTFYDDEGTVFATQGYGQHWLLVLEENLGINPVTYRRVPLKNGEEEKK